MALRQMDKIGVVVGDLGVAIAFVQELGPERERRAMIEGKWIRGVTCLGDQHIEIAMMRTPNGSGRQ